MFSKRFVMDRRRGVDRFFKWNTSASGSTHVHNKEPVNVSSDSYEPFIKTYCDLVSDKDYPSTFLERAHHSLFPVVVDVTMKFRDVSGDRDPFNDMFLMGMTSCCQQAIVNTYTVRDSQDELYCILLSADYTINDNIGTSAIRLWFPLAVTTSMKEQVRFKNNLLDLIRENNICAYLSRMSIDHLDDAITVARMEYPMYRSVEEVGVYRFKACMQIMDPRALREVEGISFDDNTVPVSDVFSPVDHNYVDNVDEGRGDTFYLPVYLTPSYYDKIIKEVRIENKEDIKDEYYRISTLCTKKTIEDVDSDEYIITMTKKFLEMLDPARYTSQTNWEDIGKCIHNSYRGADEGLDLWITSMNRAYGDNRPEFIKLLCGADSFLDTMEFVYSTMGTNNYLTYKTLAWYASTDSPERYKRWHHNWICSAMAMAMYGREDALITQLVYRVFWLRIMYNDRAWFMFSKGSWDKCPQGNRIKKLASSTLTDLIQKKISEVTDEASTMTANQETERQRLNFIVENLSKLSSLMLNYTMQNKVLSGLSAYFEINNFRAAADSNIYCLGVRNGVIDFKGDTVVHREAKPEDYITKSTGHYFKERSWSDRGVIFVMSYLKKIFPEEDVLVFWIKMCAYMAVGKNPYRFIIILLGVMGSEGKSVLARFIRAVFGDYAINLPSNVYKQDSKRGAAQPELSRARNTRILLTSEIVEEGEKLRDDVAKGISGEDLTYERPLYGEGGDMIPTFMSMFLTNIPIEFSNMDSAMRDRIVLFDLKTRFFSYHSTDPNKVCPRDPEEQERLRIYPRDDNFVTKLIGHSSHFLWIITQYWPLVVNEGMGLPKSVLQTTSAYTKEQDHYANFIEAHIEADTSSKLHAEDVIPVFLDWYRMNNPGDREPKPRTIINNINKTLGAITKHGWVGYKLANVLGGQSDEWTN